MKRKSKYKSKKKKIKKRIRVKTPLKIWYSVSVFWFKLCSRRLTERTAASWMKKQRSAPKGKPIQIFLSTRISSTSANIYHPNTTLKEPAFNCSFVHKGSVLPQYSYWITPVLLLDYSSTSIEVLQYSLLDYSSTPIELLQYSYWITPVLLLDYSSTSIGLLQYSYWITPVLLLNYSSTCIGYDSSTCIGILYLFTSCLAQLTKIFSYLLAVILFFHQLISKVSCLLYLQGFSFAG